MDNQVVDKDIFTENDVIGSIEMGDSSVEITGYVEKLIAKSIATNGAAVFRIIISNAQSRKVQLVAWQKNIPLLESVAEINKVLTIERLYSKHIFKNSKFNDGNVEIELMIGPSTKITVEGIYKGNEGSTSTFPAVEFENIRNARGIIRIQGFIKNSFRQLRSKMNNRGIGSLTNGDQKIEVHICNYSDHIFQKGHAVEVVGELCQRVIGQKTYSPYFMVKSMTDIKLLKKRKASLEFLFEGYRYLE